MFVKLFNQILDSSIADNRPLRHFFTDLLLCCDPQGFVVMTESAIARRIGATLEEVKWGLEELEKPDPRSKTPDNEGRRIERLEGSGYGWRILNFETYKLMRSAEDMREKTRERVRRFRDKTKDVTPCNAPVTLGNACNPMKRKMNTKKESKEEEEKGEGKAKAKTPSGEDEVFEKWNSIPELPKIAKISPSRKAQAKTMLSESFFAENWRAGMDAIASTPFLLGKSDRGWKADIDWFLKPDSLARIIEGKYGDAKKSTLEKETLFDASYETI